MQLDVEDSNDLALSLTDLRIAINAHDLGDLSLDTIVLGLDVRQLLSKIILRPRESLTSDPMPIVGAGAKDAMLVHPNVQPPNIMLEKVWASGSNVELTCAVPLCLVTQGTR